MTTEEPTVQQHATDLATEYSQRLDAFVNEIVPPVLELNGAGARVQ